MKSSSSARIFTFKESRSLQSYPHNPQQIITTMEAKLLFFTRSENGRWSLTAQSISTIQLDTTPSIPSLEETDYPSPLSELINLISKKCANNGIMDGWYCTTLLLE